MLWGYTLAGMDMSGEPESATRSIDRLIATDPDLARVVSEFGRPAVWSRPEGFPALVLFILEQQVSLASARAAYDRLDSRIGGVTPEGVRNSSDEDLRADGFSRQKARYVRALAEACVSGGLDLAVMRNLHDDDVRRSLTAIPGIGPWTADVYLIACLGRPDVWPTGDRALQVSAGEVLHLPGPLTVSELELLGERWRPLRSSAARLLWHAYLSRRGR